MDYTKGSGKESEWNEANFKSKRLHDLQEAINYLKSNPLGMTDGKFNYEWLAKNIEALYGEGRSKYSPKEKEEMDNLRELVIKSMKFLPPQVLSYHDSLVKSQRSYMLVQKNYDILLNLLYIFEMKARDLNDEHGLTTRNKGTAGLFG